MTAPALRATIDLTWYFAEGIVAFERSPFGAMLDRAELFEAPAALSSGWRGLEYADALAADIEVIPVRDDARHEREAPDRKLLERYGRCSRRLAEVERQDATAATALAAAFGPEGAYWAGHERGRAVALFLLTQAGRRLVVRGRMASEGSTTLSDREVVRVEVQLDTLTRGRSTARRALVVSATREANDLLARALELWSQSR